MLVAHGFIKDDCARYFLPVPLLVNNQWYSIDKMNPGVIIKIMSKKEYKHFELRIGMITLS